MAIQMRRGNEDDLDITKLKAGEIAVCLDKSKMIVKLADENYLTLTDIPEIRELVDGKAEATHTHDDRYDPKYNVTCTATVTDKNLTIDVDTNGAIGLVVIKSTYASRYICSVIVNVTYVVKLVDYVSTNLSSNSSVGAWGTDGIGRFRVIIKADEITAGMDFNVSAKLL